MKKKIPEAFHPGEYLMDELRERNMTPEDLAKKTGVIPDYVKDVISKQESISPYFAKGLGKILGTGSGVWLNLQTVYELTKKIRSARMTALRKP